MCEKRKPSIIHPTRFPKSVSGSIRRPFLEKCDLVKTPEGHRCQVSSTRQHRQLLEKRRLESRVGEKNQLEKIDRRRCRRNTKEDRNNVGFWLGWCGDGRRLGVVVLGRRGLQRDTAEERHQEGKASLDYRAGRPICRKILLCFSM